MNIIVELRESLIRINETLDNIQKDRILHKNDYRNHQKIITDVAMEYLQQNNPTNVFFMFLMMDLLPDSGKILN